MNRTELESRLDHATRKSDLHDLSSAVVPDLADIVRSGGGSELEPRKRRAIDALAVIAGTRAVSALLSLAGDEALDAWLREASVLELGNLPADSRVVPFLAEAFHQRDFGLRKSALLALSRIETTEARALVEAARADSNSEIRRLAERTMNTDEHSPAGPIAPGQI